MDWQPRNKYVDFNLSVVHILNQTCSTAGYKARCSVF
jgi:hypothetical protein